MRVLIDMNLSPCWKSRLAGTGIESEHSAMIGAPAAPDSEIMSYARPNV
jgi:predicted nuclease of predicted toxin-antitoxin system